MPRKSKRWYPNISTYENKLICGIKHIKVPCNICKLMIWVSADTPNVLWACRTCYCPGSVGEVKTDAGRVDEGCSSEGRYNGNCTAE